MSKSVQGIAIDLGASAGKVFLGSFDGRRVTLKEVYRFHNGVIHLKNHIYWDVLHIFEEIKKGLALAAGGAGHNVISIGLDAWGNDFCLLDKDGHMLGYPHSYRDPRTDGVMQQAFHRMSREEIYRHTGTQFMQTNTLYQLYSMVLEKSALLKSAGAYLMIADLFNFWMTGEKRCEFTNATTTQFVDPIQRSWCQPVLKAMRIPLNIMPPVINAGSRLGNLESWLCDSTGLKPLPVIAVGTHDTASAVSAVPFTDNKSAFLSSGTWSLLGAEVKQPVVNKKGLTYNFTCYGGVCDTFLVWKNIQGLWLLQECIRAWGNDGIDINYRDLLKSAQKTPRFKAFINPDDRSFLTPGDFPAIINDFCLRSEQQSPVNQPEIIRCILDSLAMTYRSVFAKLQEVLGRKLEKLYIVGGGSQNTLLNQLTADALGVRVIAGLPEATSLGNFMMQMIALGEVGSLDESREIIRSSFMLQEYQPSDTGTWQEMFTRFADVTSHSTTYNQ